MIFEGYGFGWMGLAGRTKFGGVVPAGRTKFGGAVLAWRMKLGVAVPAGRMKLGVAVLAGLLLLVAGGCVPGGSNERVPGGSNERVPGESNERVPAGSQKGAPGSPHDEGAGGSYGSPQGNVAQTVWSVEPDASGSSAHVRDMLGRQVQVPWPVERVIGLRAGALRMLVYLQATEQVIAVEEPERRSDRPYVLARPELAGLPTIGPQMGGDVEELVAARPQVLFLTFTNAAQADELQARTGIPVVALEYGDFIGNRELFFSSLSLMGFLLGVPERARALADFTEQTLAELDHRTAGAAGEDRPEVYVGGIAYRGARGIASTEPWYPPAAFVNAFNMASTLDARLVHPVQGTTVDVEQLISWDPEAIFIDVFSRHLVRRELAPGTPLARSLSAVRNGRLYSMLPYNNYATNYETLLANAWAAGKALYPDRFDDISVQQKADEVFRMFLGQAIYDKMAALHGGYGTIDLLNTPP